MSAFKENEDEGIRSKENSTSIKCHFQYLDFSTGECYFIFIFIYNKEKRQIFFGDGKIEKDLIQQ